MRIGMDARVLTLPELRGIANYILEILEFWPEHDEFLFFYESGKLPENIDTRANISFIHVPEPKGTRFKTWYWQAMPKTLRKMEPLDVLWCPANIPIPFSGCKQILTLHDTLLQEPFRRHSFFDRFFYRYIVPFWARKYVNTTITVSSFSKSRITALFKIKAKKIRVIHNGLPSVNPSCVSSIEAKNKLKAKGIVVSGRYIFALGAESFWKNTECLLRSFAYLHQHCSDLEFVVTGIQESSLDKYKNLATSLGLGSHIKLLKYVDSSTKNTLYQGAELFVYPSLFEGFGFPPLEAMKLGCPVIASDRASIPEVVGTAAKIVDCSLDVNISNAILNLINDENQKQKLINAGSKNILRFNWETCAAKHRNEFTIRK